mgnify:CR=1 FL=1
MITKFKDDLDIKYSKDAISLWIENFNDSKQFAKYFIEDYSANHDYIWTIHDDNVVSMAYIIKKNVLIKGSISVVYLIVGMATKNIYSKKGLMKNIINLILEKYKNEFIFMQADHWEYYKNWNFLNVSSIYNYKVKHCNHEKIMIDNFIDWSSMNKQFNNQGSIQYDIKSFQEYINMFIIDGAKIASIGETYIVYKNNTVINFAFKEFKTFINLLNMCEINFLQTHFPIESNYLSLKNEKKYTKSTHIFSNVIFNSLF